MGPNMAKILENKLDKSRWMATPSKGDLSRVVCESRITPWSVHLLRVVFGLAF